MPRIRIATKQAKRTLEQLHAKLAGKILDNKAEAKRLAQAMKHVEAVLKIIESDVPIGTRARKPNPWFKSGTMFRHALDALRTAETPLTAREIVVRMLTARGETNATPRTVRGLRHGVQLSLRKHSGQSVVRIGEGTPARWQII